MKVFASFPFSAHPITMDSVQFVHRDSLTEPLRYESKVPLPCFCTEMHLCLLPRNKLFDSVCENNVLYKSILTVRGGCSLFYTKVHWLLGPWDSNHKFASLPHPHFSKIDLSHSHHKSSHLNVPTPNCGASPFPPRLWSHCTRYRLSQPPFVPIFDDPSGSLVPVLRWLLDLKCQSGPIIGNVRYGPLQRESLLSTVYLHNSKQIEGISGSVILHACLDSKKLKSMACVLIWCWLHRYAQFAKIQQPVLSCAFIYVCYTPINIFKSSLPRVNLYIK